MFGCNDTQYQYYYISSRIYLKRLFLWYFYRIEYNCFTSCSRYLLATNVDHYFFQLITILQTLCKSLCLVGLQQHYPTTASYVHIGSNNFIIVVSHIVGTYAQATSLNLQANVFGTRLEIISSEMKIITSYGRQPL